jgi:hypothetical protein
VSDTIAAPLVIEPDVATNCPVCGFGGAFSEPGLYDTCARCGWVDDPEAYVDPDRASGVNGATLSRAVSAWPERLLERLTSGPRSEFTVTTRTDSIGGYDFVAGGVRLTELFPGAKGMVANISLLDGSPQTPTGRHQLYMCHLCGDPWCGSLTADVRFLADRVVWSRIGLERYDEPAGRWELAARRDPAGFAFELESYRRTMRGLQPR